MDELVLEEAREISIPRWVQVPVGLILGLAATVSAFGAAAMLLAREDQHPVSIKVGGAVMLLACCWLMGKAFRLVMGRKSKGGLVSPNDIRAFSVCLLILPVAGLFTGWYRQMGFLAFLQGAAYFYGFFRLQAWARKREA